MRRVPEVIDCWFDSGCMPFAQWGYPHVAGQQGEVRAEFPGELHQRGDRSDARLVLLAAHDLDARLRRETQKRLGPHPYKTCIVLGHVGDKEGKKESKSKGNYTPPDIVYDEVKMEFAVMSQDAAKAAYKGLKLDAPLAGRSLVIAPEEMDGLDLGEKATVEVQTGATMIAACTVTPQEGAPAPHRAS